MSSELMQLRERIAVMSSSSIRLALVEEAIRLADSLNDVEAGFALRETLTSEALTAGRPELTLVAVGWMLARSDADRDRFPESKLLWRYKWAVHQMCEFPEIPLARIDEALADMAIRFERNGASLRPVYQQRCMLGCRFGIRDRVVDNFPKWMSAARDSYSDCHACDRGSVVVAHQFLGEFDKGLALAEEIIRSNAWCSSVPHTTYCKTLETLVRLGEFEKAAEYHRAGIALIRGQSRFIDTLSFHMIYLLLVKDLAGAVKLFERHLPLALTSTSPIDKFFFYRACVFLFRRLKRSKRAEKRLNLPSTFPLWSASGGYDLGSLFDWFDTEARSLAARFDRRNGTTYRTGQIDELEELERLIPA